MTDFNDLLGDVGGGVYTPEMITQSLKWLIYGASGTGKTSLAASVSNVPELSPVLYVDMERGALPAEKHGNMENMVLRAPNNLDEFKKLLQRIEELHGKGKNPFKTIVIDTIDKLQERILEKYQGAGNSFEVWRRVYQEIVDMLNAIAFKMGLTVICITHEARVEDAVTGGTYIGPLFEGKKSNAALPAIFDFIGRLAITAIEDGEDTKNVRVLYLEPGTEALSKRRVAGMPEAMGNPTFPRLWEYIINTDTEEEE